MIYKKLRGGSSAPPKNLGSQEPQKPFFKKLQYIATNSLNSFKRLPSVLANPFKKLSYHTQLLKQQISQKYHSKLDKLTDNAFKHGFVNRSANTTISDLKKSEIEEFKTKYKNKQQTKKNKRNANNKYKKDTRKAHSNSEQVKKNKIIISRSVATGINIARHDKSVTLKKLAENKHIKDKAEMKSKYDRKLSNSNPAKHTNITNKYNLEIKKLEYTHNQALAYLARKQIRQYVQKRTGISKYLFLGLGNLKDAYKRTKSSNVFLRQSNNNIKDKKFSPSTLNGRKEILNQIQSTIQTAFKNSTNHKAAIYSTLSNIHDKTNQMEKNKTIFHDKLVELKNKLLNSSQNKSYTQEQYNKEFSEETQKIKNQTKNLITKIAKLKQTLYEQKHNNKNKFALNNNKTNKEYKAKLKDIQNKINNSKSTTIEEIIYKANKPTNKNENPNKNISLQVNELQTESSNYNKHPLINTSAKPLLNQINVIEEQKKRQSNLQKISNARARARALKQEQEQA